MYRQRQTDVISSQTDQKPNGEEAQDPARTYNLLLQALWSLAHWREKVNHKDIEELIERDDTVTVLFAKHITGGYRTATLMTKGRGDWIKGKGPTVEDAFADLMSQVYGTPRPVTVETAPVAPSGIVTRMPG